MKNRQLDFIYPYEVPADMHPMAPILIKPLGLTFTVEAINDLCRFLFDMVGVKLFDVEPTVVHYSWGWGDPREVDLLVPGGEYAAVWSPQLPPGLVLEASGGRLHGVLPAGPWECDIHAGPAVKYDALGGSGSPNEDGVWIGALEERKPVEGLPIDVGALSDEQRQLLLAQLTKGGGS